MFLASELTFVIGIWTPSIVTFVNDVTFGLAIVVPTPVVLGFPDVPSSIEVSAPWYLSSAPLPSFAPRLVIALPFASPAVTAVLYSAEFVSVTYLAFPFESTTNLELSVKIPVEPSP